MQNFGMTNKKYYGVLWYFLEWSIPSDWRDTSKSVFRGKIRGYLIDTLLDMDDYVEVDN